MIADYNNEIFNNTNHVLSNNGYKIINIDLETNSIYNPFMYIENELDAQTFSHLIVKQNEYKSEDVFKEDMCEIIFRIIAQYSLKMLPKEKQNLYYCLKILKELKDNNAKYLQFVMSKLDSSAEIMKYYDTIGKISDDNYHLLLEILENKLNTLGELTTLSSTNLINFEEIATTRTALYVNISSKQNINAIFFTQLTQKLFINLYENVCIVRNRGKTRIICRARNIFKLLSADKHSALVGAARAYYEIYNRALSAAALADDRRHTLFGESHGYIF